MNTTPKSAPVYGGGPIVIELYSNHAQEQGNYYFVFKGSKIRHVTFAAPYWNSGTLQLRSTIPDVGEKQGPSSKRKRK